MTAYFAYQAGQTDTSLMQYLFLAEMGYEIAQINSAYIIESGKGNLMHASARILKLRGCIEQSHFLVTEKIQIFHQSQIYPLALLLWNRAARQGMKRVKNNLYQAVLSD